MLSKFFIACSLTMGVMAGLQADEKVPPTQQTEEASKLHACDKCGERALTPGALVCNESENRCLNDEGNNEESASSKLFADLCDHQEDDQLLACDKCN